MSSERGNWFDVYFRLGQKKFDNYDEPEGKAEPKFDDDPDPAEPIVPPEPEWRLRLRQWQDNLSAAFRPVDDKREDEQPLDKIEQTAPPTAPRQNEQKPFQLVNPWMRRYAMRRFGMGAPTTGWQNWMNWRPGQQREVSELDEAIANLEAYQQRLSKKAARVGKRVEQLKAERNRVKKTQVKITVDDKRSDTPLDQR